MSYTIIKKLVVSPKAREWCLLPYPGHPRGCPMFGRKPTCPPQAPMIQDFLDPSKSLYIVWAEFNLAAHAQRMKQAHPNWSERQCRCLLYWQQGVRAELRHNVQAAMMMTGTTEATLVPEAMGVNVYATCAASGLRLDRIRDIKVDRHVAIMGYPANKKGLLF